MRIGAVKSEFCTWTAVGKQCALLASTKSGAGLRCQCDFGFKKWFNVTITGSREFQCLNVWQSQCLVSYLNLRVPRGASVWCRWHDAEPGSQVLDNII